MKPSFLLSCLFFTIILVLSGTPASAKQAALIIGNGDYRVGGLLSNPANDAELVESALRKAQFDVVEAKRNLGMPGCVKSCGGFKASPMGRSCRQFILLDTALRLPVQTGCCRSMPS